MSEAKKILLLPGDGIGKEIIKEAVKVLGWMNDENIIDVEFDQAMIGGESIDMHGIPLTEETIEKAKKADANLMGAVGGPKWDNIPFDKKPERGLLGIRNALGLFANLRPAIAFDELAGASSLKKEIVSGLDIMIVRELTGGIYFGQPRGETKNEKTGQREGKNTLYYSESEVKRIAKFAFEIAKKRSFKLCSVDKANVLEATLMWRDIVTEMGEKEYKDVELSHLYVDNASMQLVRNPKQFDVIVTTNMFGDILSDTASMLTGSLGMLPSASLGEEKQDGSRNALYEPVHGSAPDIMGQGKANPLAMILSASMMLRYSFNWDKEADMIDNAVKKALSMGYRTADIMEKDAKLVSTSEMGDVVLQEVKKLAK